MGCFGQACLASKMPIGFGPKDCMIVPVLKREHTDINTGPFADWYPLTLPIRGSYDHYGRLESVVRDDNTVILEQRFGCPITTLVRSVCGDRSVSEDVFGPYELVGAADVVWLDPFVYDGYSLIARNNAAGEPWHENAKDLREKTIEQIKAYNNVYDSELLKELQKFASVRTGLTFPFEHFAEVYAKNFNEKLLPELETFVHFVSAMYDNNIQFYPNRSLLQDSECEAQLPYRLFDVTMLKARIAQAAEDEKD